MVAPRRRASLYGARAERPLLRAGRQDRPLDKHGRRLRTLALDALGYNAETSDPLYKHWPYLIARDAGGTAYGLLYDTLAGATFDLGCEHDNYHGFYRYCEIEGGDLDYYLFIGPTIRDVVRKFSELTGRTAFGPRWSLGYANTAMSLTDAPDAQARLSDFIDKAAEHDIPISAFHFGSGYSSIGPRRYVFTWNRDKFPDPRALVGKFERAGIQLPAGRPAAARGPDPGQHPARHRRPRRDARRDPCGGGGRGHPATCPPRSAVVMPLLIGQRAAGVAVLGRDDGRPRFTETDVAVIEELDRRLAAGWANVETFAREHTVAETLQLPCCRTCPPKIAGLDVAVRYLPATGGVHVGGDWYDVFPLGRDRVALAIGDVAGHSIGSASIMGQIRSLLRAYTLEHPAPADVMRCTNAAVCQLLPDALATVLYAVLDLSTGDLAYANAGHPPALVDSGDGHVEYLNGAWARCWASAILPTPPATGAPAGLRPRRQCRARHPGGRGRR